MNETKLKLRWFKFSLRTLLLSITLLCIWLGLKVSAAGRQHEVVATLIRAGAQIQYDYQAAAGPDDFKIDEKALPWEPAWLRRELGDDYFHNVTGITFHKQVISASDFSEIAKLRSLSSLILDRVKITANVSGGERPIQNSDLVIVEELAKLRNVFVYNAEIDGDSLVHLVNLKHLKDLRIVDTPLDDSATEPIGNITSLECLCLTGTAITDSGLQNIRLHNLDTLILERTKISDAGLRYLKGLKKLTYLDLIRTRVTPEGIRELQKSLPTATITGP